MGVNNRDLKTFEVSSETSLSLVGRISASVVRVTESGISTREDIQRLRKAGFDAFLIGESLMRQPDPGAALVKLLKGVPRKRRASGSKFAGTPRLRTLWWRPKPELTRWGSCLRRAHAGLGRSRRRRSCRICRQRSRRSACLSRRRFGEIAATVEAAGLTGVQLHWDVPAELAAVLRARFGPKLRILRVVHFDAGTDPLHWRRMNTSMRSLSIRRQKQPWAGRAKATTGPPPARLSSKARKCESTASLRQAG